MNEIKNELGREVKTQRKSTMTDYRDFLRAYKANLPAYSKLRKAELVKLAARYGYAEEKTTVVQLKEFFRNLKNAVPAYSRMRKAELKALAERFGYGQVHYYSTTIRFQWRVESKQETTWRTETNTFSTRGRPQNINQQAMMAASDIAQTHMSQDYSPEIKDLEIISTTEIKPSATELKEMKLYARGYDYVNLAMNSEYEENNQCVYDFLKDKYLEKIFNKLSVAEQESLVGITPVELILLLDRFNTTIIFEDLLMRPILSKLVGHKDRESSLKKRVRPIMLKIANNHIYVIEDEQERNSMTKRAISSSTVPNKKIEKKIPVCKFISGDDKALKAAISEAKELTHYYTERDDLNKLFKSYLSENIVPYVSLTNDSITEIRIKAATLKCLPDGKKHFDSIQKLKSDVKGKHSIAITGSSYGSIASQLATGLKVNWEESLMNDSVRDLFQKVSTGGLVRKYYNKKPCRSSKRFYGLDMTRAYPAALKELTSDIPVFDVSSKVESIDFKVVEPFSFYVVEHKNTDINTQFLHSNSLAIALRINLIQPSEVKAIIRGRPMKFGRADLINFVDNCLDLHSGKFLINSFIGLQARMETLGNTRNIITKSREEAVSYYLEGEPMNNQFIQIENDDVNNQTYLVSLSDKTIRPYTSKPMYLAITQYTRMKMLEKKFQLEKLGATVSSIKTDCIYFGVPDKCQKAYKAWAKDNVLNKKVARPGMLKRENADKVKAEFNSQLSREEDVRVIDSIDVSYQITQLPITKLHKPSIDDIVCFDRAIISGAGGSGKSYLLSRMVKFFEDGDLKCKVLSPTNIAAGVLRENLADCGAISESLTIHTGLGINYKDSTVKPSRGLKDVDVLFIDECSMLTKQIWGVLINALRESDMKLYVFGDFRQLPPIEQYAECFTDLAILGEIFEKHLELTHNYRTNGNAEFVNYCKNLHDTDTSPEAKLFGDSIEDFAICKTNRMRKAFNEFKMDEFSSATDPVVEFGQGVSEEDAKQLQPTKLYQGLPIQCVNSELAKKYDLPFMKRQFFTVTNVEDTPDGHVITVIPNNSTDEYQISSSQFANIMVPAYCTTVHSIQGKTLNNPYTILEYRSMTAKQMYTSLTRTTDPKNISFSNNLFGCDPRQLNYVYNLLDTENYAYIHMSEEGFTYTVSSTPILGAVRRVQYYDADELKRLVRGFNRLCF